MQTSPEEVSRFRLTFSLLILLIFFNVAESGNSTARIVGGRPTEIYNVPYLVYILRDGDFVCGGTLVSPLHVVTAAHCIKGVSRKSLTIVGGASRLSRRGIRRNVSKVRLPLVFNKRTMDKDIAVIKLSSPMTGRYIKPIELCNSKLKAGDIVKVSGWGTTNQRNSQASNRVRTVNLRMIPKKVCRQRYPREILTSSMICAFSPGKDSCQGDSGGPLVHNGRLCAVVSWGDGCAKKNFPGVYTSINQLRGFIKRAMTP